MPNVDRDAEQVTCHDEAAPPAATVTIDRKALTKALRRHGDARQELLHASAVAACRAPHSVVDRCVNAEVSETDAYAALRALLEVSDDDRS